MNAIKNSTTSSGRFSHVGWSLGNYCPFSCTHCYSEWVREATTGLSTALIDRITVELGELGVRHITLGGNEPFFTNGPRTRDSQLPFIIRSLAAHRIAVHLVSSGPSVTLLAKADRDAFRLLATVSLSVDSPFAAEHDRNRGAKLFRQLMDAVDAVTVQGLPLIFLYCAMNWNFDEAHIHAFLEMSRARGAIPRINPAKPIVKAGVIVNLLNTDRFWSGFDIVTREVPSQVVTEPKLRSALGLDRAQPSCGDSTFRICSTAHDGSIAVSPCTYVHPMRNGDLRSDSLIDVVQRLERPGCNECLARSARQDWAAAADVASIPDWSDRHCAQNDLDGAFENYLCTWIGARL